MDTGTTAHDASFTHQSDVEAALHQLRLKLLDLSGRNRLLNFKHTASRSIQFVEGSPLTIYQRLVEAANRPAVIISGVPEPSRNEWVERSGRLARPDVKEWASQLGIPTSYDLSQATPNNNGARLRALFYPDDLAKHCRKLEREANSAIQETGANMLFLVLGFLEFPEQPDSDKQFLAPLISVPVQMFKADAAGQQIFSLHYTGDDVTGNLSLEEKLKIDHGLTLPDFNEEEFDLETYFESIVSLIQKKPGFTLRRWASLCMLSFTNMLLVRDLDPENWPKIAGKNGLLDHPTVREVFEGQAAAPDTDFRSVPEHDVETGPADKIPLVFDADSSQHSALVDVLVHRKNLVIEGPPGTGKSQTISNLIAAALAEKKRVLFVAEKLAALEVVKNRLTQVKLDPFILELHSNKSNKKKVLEEIQKRLDYRVNTPADLPRKVQQLESHRNELRTYQELVNSASHNKFDLTLHQIMWRAENYRTQLSADERIFTRLKIEDASEISAFELSRRMECLNYLGTHFADIGAFETGSPFWGFFPDKMIPGEEIEVNHIFASSEGWAKQFAANATEYAAVIGVADVTLTAERAEEQLTALNLLLELAEANTALRLVPKFLDQDKSGQNASHRLKAFAEKIEKYHQLKPEVEAGLMHEDEASPEQTEALSKLAEWARVFGAELGTSSQIGEFYEELRTQSYILSEAIQKITSFCKNKFIPFDNSRDALNTLSELVELIMAAPADLLRLQSSGLACDGSHDGVTQLAQCQKEWVDFQAKLNGVLYLDLLPEKETVRQAILALREHQGWLKIFRADWRKAVATHKRLQRAKGGVTSQVRLAHLESILTLAQLRESWRTHPTWDRFLGMPAPTEPFAFDDYLDLTLWNHMAGAVLERLQVSFINLPQLNREKLRSLQRDCESVSAALADAVSALSALDALFPRLKEEIAGESVEKYLHATATFLEALHAQGERLLRNMPSEATFADFCTAWDAAIERQKLKAEIDGDVKVRSLYAEEFLGIETDVSAGRAALNFGRDIDCLKLPQALSDHIKAGPVLDTSRALRGLLDRLVVSFSHVDEFSQGLRRFGDFDLEAWAGTPMRKGIAVFAKSVCDKVAEAVSVPDLLIPWSRYVTQRKDALRMGLGEFVNFLETKQIPSGELNVAYAYSTHVTIIRSAFGAIPQLERFSGLRHDQVRDAFRRVDRDVIALRGQAIAAHCNEDVSLPSGRNGTRVDDKTEMALLSHLLPQQRPRLSVRNMIHRAGRSIQALKPCFMMGPQAVAQYLTPGAVKFDLVIMDEASQLKPEEAIGAIARGGQLVVVGDSKQLPPTSFFSRMNQASEDDDQYTTTDAESILNVCSSHFHPPRFLRWHYRSQHHSLIAFSNEHFYNGGLIIFPSPYGQSARLGVRATYLNDAVYENQTNLREAERVVDAVVEHMLNNPNETLGVVTLNTKQRDLIDEILDARVRKLEQTDAVRESWTEQGQPLFVKNLENVQGDERDAIIISTTFGKMPRSSVVRQNFGPISRQGGWRRLNVLFTRARKSVSVYTSLRPEDIVVDRTTPAGTKALRNYLEFARTGSLSVAVDKGLDPESDFEIAVINVLQGRGYEVTTQLGVAGFRLDIAVKHPDAPGTYLAAIECDGATYHSARSVRDRDRIRQEILENLGWRGRIWRIWSTDWFRTPRHETDKLIQFLEDLRRSWKPIYEAGASWAEEGQVPERTPENNIEEEAQTTVSEILGDTDDDLDVQIGDLVKYADTEKPDDVISVRISYQPSDISNGIISHTTPLAQTLLGAVAGDEVTLHLPGSRARTFRILSIVRSP